MKNKMNNKANGANETKNAKKQGAQNCASRNCGSKSGTRDSANTHNND